jgi:hypothetical protein
MMYSFYQYLLEAKAHATTGHLEHVGDLLYHGDPHSAIEHMEHTHNRFQGHHNDNHKLSLKVDGGMSIVVGRNHKGQHFVSYKTGSEQFTSHEQIAATGKEHYVRELSPVLKHAKKMEGLKPGTAFQADIVHNSEEHSEVAQPNAIKYKVPKNKKLVLAAHSQYKVGKEGELTKTTSHPDVHSMTSKDTHAPDLAMGKNVHLKLDSKRHKKISHHLGQARKLLTPETSEFAKTLPQQGKFHEFLKQYSNHEARTTGKRSVKAMTKHIDTYMSKSAQSKLKPDTQKKLRGSLNDFISNNKHHFDTLFKVHDHINQAKHHLLDELEQNHKHHFDIHTHGGEEHEGMVSSLGRPGKNEVQAKLVREGPGGFPEKNTANAAIRFGKS